MKYAKVICDPSDITFPYILQTGLARKPYQKGKKIYQTAALVTPSVRSLGSVIRPPSLTRSHLSSRMTSQTDQLVSSPEMTAAQKKLLQLNNNRNQVSPSPHGAATDPAQCGITTRSGNSWTARDIPGAQWSYSPDRGVPNGRI